MSQKAAECPSNNSRVQKITEKFETLITTQQPPPPKKIYPHTQQQRLRNAQSVQLPLPLRGGTGFQGNHEQRLNAVELREQQECRRGIKRSQAFRHSATQVATTNGDTGASNPAPQLLHSESIREALNKPLPEGPPPEKPPRRPARPGERDEPTNHQLEDDMNLLIEVAFQEPEKVPAHESQNGEQILLKRPVSEEHRKRLRRLSRCAELNDYTRQYGTIRVYDAVDGDRRHASPGSSMSVECDDDVLKSSDTKGLIKHYNKLSEKNGRKTAALPAPTLYEYCIVVGYDLLKNRPYVKSKYPPQKQPHKQIEEFVYPDNGALVRQRDQEYCIILTDYPQRYYGFCRRVLPESSEFCIPLTYCIVTKHNEPKVFYQLLQSIEGQHGNGRLAERLMKQFHEQRLPLAGESLQLALPSSQEELHGQLANSIMISRPKDLRLEKTELFDIFQCLGPDGLIQVFECLLLEKMVILFSEHLSLLSSCILALLSILYPFQWQHILITIVPDDLQQVLEAPVPMLAGTLQPVPEELWQGSADACYVNLDRRTVRLAKKERCSMLPSELKNPLRVSLELVKIFEDAKDLSSVLIGGAFVRFFIELFSNLDTQSYEKSQFVEQFQNQETRLFLNCFLETVMFADFRERWHASKVSTTSSASDGFDYTLFNSKIAEKSQNRYWHTASFDEVVANSKLIERKGKSFLEKVRKLMKKS
ncbi:DENN domain-containing protein 2D-like [Anopheles aquasalis]|uniref:DENN domain-containing protein 2D-like n=1 Tax=Anopheles aquasalis TaxID=42839 RepID=UPI00215B0DD4|nr:DENN domain-containing protein 2D-like [Anopheles aquasalis]